MNRVICLLLTFTVMLSGCGKKEVAIPSNIDRCGRLLAWKLTGNYVTVVKIDVQEAREPLPFDTRESSAPQWAVLDYSLSYPNGDQRSDVMRCLVTNSPRPGVQAYQLSAGASLVLPKWEEQAADLKAINLAWHAEGYEQHDGSAMDWSVNPMAKK